MYMIKTYRIGWTKDKDQLPMDTGTSIRVKGKGAVSPGLDEIWMI